MDYTVLESCTSSKTYEILVKNKRMDLKKATEILSAKAEEVAKTPRFALYKFEGHPVSLYESGKIIVKEIEKKEAEEIAKKLLGLLEKGGALL